MAMLDVSEYKKSIIKEILDNEEIILALESPFKEYIPESPDTLVYLNIFPYLKIPDTQTNAATYILLATDVARISRHNATFSDMHLTFWVLAHKDHMKMKKHIATRTDYIGNKLKEHFVGHRSYGFNKLELLFDKELLLNERYIYREMVFETNDLREPADKLRTTY